MTAGTVVCDEKVSSDTQYPVLGGWQFSRRFHVSRREQPAIPRLAGKSQTYAAVDSQVSRSARLGAPAPLVDYLHHEHHALRGITAGGDELNVQSLSTGP